MAFLSRPDFYFGIGFNADPNDPIQQPIWTEYTRQVRTLSALARGKQYELGQVMSASPEITIRDPDEALNPENTAGPNYGFIVPYRSTVLLGQWPNYGGGTAPVGSANLLNLNVFNNPIDPSFESYAVTTLPPWIAPGDVNPLVTSTNVHSGSRALAWTEPVSATSPVQPSWPLKCIPGRQYTASMWLRQSGGHTFGMGVAGINQAYDLFGRTSTNTWGAANLGGSYTNTGGAAADFDVMPGYGTHAQASASVIRFSQLNVSTTDADVACYVAPIFTSAAQIVRSGVSARLASAGTNGYSGTVEFSSDGVTANAVIVKRVASAETVLATVALPFNYDPTLKTGVRLVVTGVRLDLYVWREDQPAPTTPTLTTTDTSLSTAAGVGMYSQLTAGGVTSPATARFADFRATGTANGTTTTTSGAYVRLTATFTATQPDHTAYVYGTGTLTSGNVVTIDDLQNEQGASATTNTTTGPAVYPIMANYAERFTRSYDETGFEGLATLPCVDALAALSATSIPVEYQAALNATFPAYTWSLSDSATGTSFGEAVAGGTPLTPVNGPAPDAGQLTPGAQAGIPGLPGATGVTISGNGDTGHGVTLRAGGLSDVLNNGTVNCSIGFWVNSIDANRAAERSLVAFINKGGIGFYVDQPTGGGAPVLSVNGGLSTVTSPVAVAPSSVDGAWHLVVATAGVTGTNLTLNVYVDGAMVSTGVFSMASVFGTNTPLMGTNTLAIAGPTPTVPGNGAGINGTYSQVHVWSYALTAAQVLNLWNAGQGFAGELSGTRIMRHLALGGYNGPARIDAGTQMMGPPSYSPTIDLNTDTQNTTTAENGDFWIAPDGFVVFEDSNARYLRLVSTATLGENQAGGEAPYESGVKFDDDPTYVYANVQVERPNGINAVGGLPADIQAATRRFFGRPLAVIVDVQTDLQAQDLANWTFYTHNRPSTRVATITLTPSANTTLWAFALGLEIGMRITVIKRSKAANGGAGIVVSQDHFIEQITHDGIDFDIATWTTTILTSPIGSATVGNGLTVQPWILGDATLSVLGLTTIPGY